MDPLKILSRSAKPVDSAKRNIQHISGSGDKHIVKTIQPDNRSVKTDWPRTNELGCNGSSPDHVTDSTINFFEVSNTERRLKRRKTDSSNKLTDSNAIHPVTSSAVSDLPIEDCKRILRQHKVKVTCINSYAFSDQRPDKSKHESKRAEKPRVPLFPQPVQSFIELEHRYGVSKTLSANIAHEGFSTPTEVQLSALSLLLDDDNTFLSKTGEHIAASTTNIRGCDLLTIAPTGSGKTLAFMIHLIHQLQKRDNDKTHSSRYLSALVLAPTKELVNQIVNEGRKLVRGSAIRVAAARKGMRVGDDAINGETENVAASTPIPYVKADILVSTPGTMQSLLTKPTSQCDGLSQVRWLVLDEADVLLDPLFREQTMAVWDSLNNQDLRVSLWSATMGSSIEELAASTISNHRQRLSKSSLVPLQEAPLIRLVVGLKDSAVPNVQHKLIYAATEHGKLMGLRQMLHPTSTTDDGSEDMRPPFLIFTQTIERAKALHSELLYDIPAEAGGISRIAVLHSDLSDVGRDSIMTRFRKGEIWVLITTDLLSRGVDFRGINVVVNYDIPTSSAAYVHRVGRTGRAGREGGIAVTLYSQEDIPYLKHVANVISVAQSRNGEQSGVQRWLLESLPKLSKNEKRNLKQRGIESRTARGREKDPKAARKARIGTQSGYLRRLENRRKGAVEGSRRRAEAGAAVGSGEDSDFNGFD